MYVHCIFYQYLEVQAYIASAASVEGPAPPSTIINFLAVGVDTSSFEGQIPRPLELIGAPFLF